MKLGIDFDNTIVDYDEAFFLAARERDLVSESIGMTKKAVKRHLVGMGREDDWTELQGYIYGPGIAFAKPYPGLAEFLGASTSWGYRELLVVSHKTRTPYRGPDYDLHAYARGWLEASGLAGYFDAVHFETTKEEKIRRIAAEECDAFIDDLPEILGHELFPASRTRRILFDPTVEFGGEGFETAASWRAIGELLHGE